MSTCHSHYSGLGAVLLQNGQPIAYKSRALSSTEQRYAQIEKELLAVVFGTEKFDQYTLGRPVVMETDHKPLEMIAQKQLHQAPRRLQQMLKLQCYTCQFVYKRGSLMYIADPLSRA